MKPGRWMDIERLAAGVPDGASLAVPSDVGGVAMAATRALIRRGVRDLHLIGVPTSGLQADLLIGAGCVRSIEVSAVSLAEHGLAPRFGAAAKAGSIVIRDATCPAVHAGLLAAEKGVPFMAIRGLIGSDVLAHRPEWKTIANPYPEIDGGDPIVLVPAIRPDAALFHAPFADRQGNVWIGMRRELMTMAHASKTTLVTVEEIREGNLFDDAQLAPGVIPTIYITAIAEAKRGALPLGLFGCYGADDAHLAAYAKAARTEEGFARYLAEHVLKAAS